MMTTLATTTILLASVAPIALFFTLTTDNYNFLILMHFALCGLCGMYGVVYLARGCAYLAFRMKQPLNNLLLKIWIILYAVVGMQLGWRLRPFIGDLNEPFELFRSEIGGNIYITIWHALTNLSR